MRKYVTPIIMCIYKTRLFSIIDNIKVNTGVLVLNYYQTTNNSYNLISLEVTGLQVRLTGSIPHRVYEGDVKRYGR